MKTSSSYPGIFKQVVDNAGIMVFSSWLGRLIVFLSSIFVVRILGADLYGTYVLGRKILEVAVIFTVFGLDLAVVKYVAAYREADNQIKLQEAFYSAFVLGAVFSVTVSIFLLLAAKSLESIFHMVRLGHVLTLLAFALPFFVFLKLNSSYFVAEKQIKYSSPLNSIILPGLKFIVIVILFFFGLRLDAVLFGLLVSMIFAFLISAWLLRTRFNIHLFRSIGKFRFPEARRILSYSSVVTAAQVLMEMMNKVDIYMIGYFLVAAKVGIYGIVLEVAAVFTVILHSFNHIFAPLISGAWQKGEVEKISHLYKFQSKMIFIFTFPMALFVFLYPDTILSVFGPEITAGKTALIIVTAGQLLNCATGGIGFILAMTGRQKLQLFNTVVVLSINIVLNYFWIKKYGITGAALATSVSFVFVNIIRIVQVKVIYGFSFIERSWIKPFASGLLVFLLFKLLVPEFSRFYYIFPLGIGFLGIYFLGLYLFGLEKNEREILAAYSRKLLPRRAA